MEADDVVIAYLRKKLGAARSGRAEKLLKPQQSMEEKGEDSMSPEDEEMLGSLSSGPCPECGDESGECDC